MRPLRTYIKSLQPNELKTKEDRELYKLRVKQLADKAGVSVSTLYAVANAKAPAKVSALKAFRIEAHTGGEVPAESINPEATEIMMLVMMVDGARQRIAAARSASAQAQA